MIKSMIQKTRYHSFRCGSLAKGCTQCVLGQKMVLFVTGLCPLRCFYCPLSDAKKDKDVIFANEWKLKDEDDVTSIIAEAKLTEAKGAGITVGDPLVRTDRVCRYIQLLKKRFGKNFHVHLYTILRSLTPQRLKKLYDAGLDEIRLHPDFESSRFWQNIDLVSVFDWDIGIEIPAIPDKKKETMKMIGYFKDKIDFLNLNELEISDLNAEEFVARGYRPKDRISYGVEGSEKLAKELMKEYGNGLRIHYCTTTLKDRVQLANRIKIRAKNAARAFDLVDEEGMLTRGAVYLPEILPEFGYRKKLEKIHADKAKSKKLTAKLKKIERKLIKKYKIPKKFLAIDEMKYRLLTTPQIAQAVKEKGLHTALVTEYPTWDQTEIEIEMMS